MRGSCSSLTELEYHLEEVYKATTDQLDWVNPEGQQYPHNLLHPLPLIPDNRGRRFYEYAVNRESTRDVYSKRRIIVVTDLQIMEWHDYKHLDWISVRCDDDQIYKFKEGDFKWLRLQDIEDMLLLLEHCHPEARRRSSTRSGKLPEEAQPDKARHVPNRSEAT
uniref:Uncharacterized protein n=1 Tax=Tanacetum cinerariifolium TaxID=118510 RepID=A0A699QB67_TANCI|nr:hypothetical protein [Tanacetum cinerariifolium]